MLSVNQINAQVNILEMWKATYFENYPLKIEEKIQSPELPITRSANSNQLQEKGFSVVSMGTLKMMQSELRIKPLIT